jgi:hypothetical protein
MLSADKIVRADAMDFLQSDARRRDVVFLRRTGSIAAASPALLGRFYRARGSILSPI